MRHMKFHVFPAVIALFILVTVSGCTLFSDDTFGEDIVNVDMQNEAGVKDVIVIKDKFTSPEGNVLPSMEVVLFFTIANADEEQTVRNVYADLYNPFIFTEVYTSSLDECRARHNCTILPLGEKPMEIDLRSPTQEEIANIKTDAQLDFSVRYDFTSYHNYQVLVVSNNEIRNRQRSGEKIDQKLEASSSGGPVQISAEMLKRSFLLDGISASIKFVIKDVGSNGGLKDFKIANKSFEVIFPFQLFYGGAIDNISFNKPEGFSCIPPQNNDNLVRCRNDEELELHKGETSPLIFTINKVAGSGNSLATYMIRANVNYTYEIRDKFSITIVTQ